MKFSTKTKALGYSIDFTHGIRRALVGALLLVYFISLGFDVVAVTSLFAISTLIMTFFEFPTGAVADYNSRKKSLMISFFLMFLSFLGIFLFRDFWILAVFWILQDIAWTFSTGAQSGWIIDALGYSDKKSELVSLTSYEYFFEKIGHLIGGLIGLVVVAISFKFIWLVISLGYLLLFFVSWKHMEERNFKPEKIPQNYLKKSLIKAKESLDYIVHKKNKDLRILMWSEFFIVVGLSGFLVGMPLMFTQVLGVGPKYLSGVVAVVAFLTIMGPIIANKIAKKHRFGRTLFFFMAIIGISLISFAMSESIIFAVSMFVILNMSLVIFDVVIESARDYSYNSKIRASLGSVASIVWAVANSVGMFLSGIGVKFLGVVNTLWISGMIILLTSFVYLWMEE